MTDKNETMNDVKVTDHSEQAMAAAPSAKDLIHQKIQQGDVQYRELCAQEVALESQLDKIKKQRETVANQLAGLREATQILDQAS